MKSTKLALLYITKVSNLPASLFLCAFLVTAGVILRPPLFDVLIDVGSSVSHTEESSVLPPVDGKSLQQTISLFPWKPHRLLSCLLYILTWSRALGQSSRLLQVPLEPSNSTHGSSSSRNNPSRLDSLWS